MVKKILIAIVFVSLMILVPFNSVVSQLNINIEQNNNIIPKDEKRIVEEEDCFDCKLAEQFTESHINQIRIRIKSVVSYISKIYRNNKMVIKFNNYFSILNACLLFLLTFISIIIIGFFVKVFCKIFTDWLQRIFWGWRFPEILIIWILFFPILTLCSFFN